VPVRRARRNLVRSPVIAAAVACLIGSAGVLFLSRSAWIGWIVVITLVFGLVTGFASAGNQTALYSQAAAEQLGTASGLLRTFGYVGSIAASAITGIVFHASVSDSGVHLAAAAQSWRVICFSPISRRRVFSSLACWMNRSCSG
jgi:cyanate permease